ncbi:MAG: GntR family transcriptional regulator, partial [Oscillospiraceae bacterium]|nr:GntR family transcriptional regulator [Oscillospiraceae bacterium]
MFRDKTLDKNTPIPLYFQLKQLILGMIEAGDLRPGDLLPTEQALGGIFSISRSTTRQALSELVLEGYLYRAKGKGTFVAQPKL